MTEWSRRGVIGTAVSAGGGLLFWTTNDGGDSGGFAAPAPSEDVAVVTDAPDHVSWEGATLLGTLEILDGADKALCFFEYRPVGAEEVVVTDSERLEEPGEFARAVQDLMDDTEYEVRAVAETDAAFDEGRWKTFQTEPKPNIEVVTTNGVEEIGQEQARLFGEVIDMTNIDEAEAFFEFRPVTDASYQDSTKEIVVEPQEYDQLIEGLEPGTEYEGRARADATEGDWTDTGKLVTWETQAAIPDSAVAHFDATELSLSDDDSVNTWPDLSGEGNDLSAGAAPTFKTNVLNSNPVVRYDGVDDQLTRASADWTTLSVPYTFAAVVASWDSDGGNQDVISNGDTSDPYATIRWNGSEWELNAGSPDIAGTSNTDPVILIGIVNGSSSILRENGTTTATGDVGARNLASLSVGGLGAAGQHLGGDIGEALVYDANLDADGDLAAEEQRLADKWGISI